MLRRLAPAKSRGQELRRGWLSLLAASFGSGVGINGLMAYNMGLFVAPLSAEIGLTRGQFGGAVSLSMFAMALALTAVGPLADRLGGRWVAIVGSAGLALVFALGGLLQSVTGFFLLLIAMGAVGSATTSVSYTRVMVTWFDAAQGLALALVMTGVGLASMIVPPIVAATINGMGWRAGFTLLAFVASLGVPVSFLFLRPAPSSDSVARTQADHPAQFSVALHLPIFWLQASAFCLMALAYMGVMIHFAPLFADKGLGGAEAARLVSLLGATLVVSRLMVGWLSDRVHAPWIGMTTCLAAAGACLLLAGGSTLWLPVAVALIGCAIGAETDLLAYLTTRYFGLAVYGRCYALQYALFVIAAGLSPAWIGFLRDGSGSYAGPLLCSAAMGLLAALIFALLPRYPPTT